MATGNGKIANLPREIREQLNWRINEDVPGTEIVAWLNAKPEVIAVMKEHFDGRPVTEQNLSEWRKYGYQKWLSLHIVMDESQSASEDAGELAQTGINCEKLLLNLTAAYAEMIQRWNIIPAEQLIYKMGIFKNLTNGVLILRRAECTARKRSNAGRGALTAWKPELQIQAIRLEFERERLELLREKRANKSTASSSSRRSSSPESTAQSEAAKSPDGAQPGDPIPPTPPIILTDTPPPPSQSPTPSPTVPGQHSLAALPIVTPNADLPKSTAPNLESRAPSPTDAPRTSSPRNLRGLL